MFANEQKMNTDIFGMRQKDARHVVGKLERQKNQQSYTCVKWTEGTMRDDIIYEQKKGKQCH